MYTPTKASVADTLKVGTSRLFGLSPDVILCGWLGSRLQQTNELFGLVCLIKSSFLLSAPNSHRSGLCGSSWSLIVWGWTISFTLFFNDGIGMIFCLILNDRIIVCFLFFVK